MAEYTIPKPYRDFYVTNPYIELKESNERLQRIVKSGYVATDSFEGAANQVITFDSQKHGFSLTNDSSTLSSDWSFDLKKASSWERKALVLSDGGGYVIGDTISTNNRLTTKDFIPINSLFSYKLTGASNTSVSYEVSMVFYDENKKGFYGLGFSILPLATITPPAGASFVKFGFNRTDLADITAEEVVSDLSSLSLSFNNYTAPSDITVKVAENVAGIPTTADGWEQGSYFSATGLPLSTEFFVRTANAIPVKPNVLYALNASFSTNTYYVTVYHYNKNKQHIETTTMTSFPVNFKTSNETEYINISLHINSSTTITPTSAIGELNYIRLTSEKMIVQENDTRIITMPPFTSLYIESNVPYHGHALDLAE